MKWKKVDPIPRFEKFLRESGINDTKLGEQRERAQKLNDEALEFATKSDYPKPETFADFVFA